MTLRLDDTLALVLEVAHSKGAAPAIKIVMRREIWELVCRDRGWPVDEYKAGDIYLPPVSDRLPIEISNSIPIFPGFQVHRDYTPRAS